MPKLNQIIAIEKHSKGTLNDDITAAYHLVQKTEPLKGIARVYTPKDDEGDKLPPESTRVQVNVEDALKLIAKSMSKLFDITATKDFANCNARADVRLDGEILLTSVPVTYLLFLEKQLTDMHTIAKKFPTLDPAESWSFDPAQNAFATEPVQSVRTKKVLRNHVKAEATDKHPAQVDTYSEDIVVGYWRTVKYSGALPAKRLGEILDRIDKLRDAVKFAREEANSIEVTNQTVGETVFAYLFGK